MEVELGLKITKTRDDITSISDFQFAKDRAGPLFLSKETETKFILYAHLKGYKIENIKIKISEDGSEIWVSGEKAVQEMTMIPLNKMEEVKMRGFRKKFKIPEEVVLDGIKASYDEEEWELTIVMPKMVKGISGVGIDEVKEEPEKDQDDNRGRAKVEAEQHSAEEGVKKEEEAVEESRRPEHAEQSDEVSEKEINQDIKKQRPRKPWKPCPPLLLGGSTFLVSLLFLVIHYIRLKNK